MHVYEAAGTPGDVDWDALEADRFRGPEDILRWADRVLGETEAPWVWHLDAAGGLGCWFEGFAGSSLRGWARDPSDLWRSWLDGEEAGGCCNRWVIVDRGSAVDEVLDVDAFLRLQDELRPTIDLVDAVVFDGRRRWWSIRELATGVRDWGVRVA